MALIICKDCESKISRDAKYCVQCGAKNRSSSKYILAIVGAALLAFSFSGHKQSMRPEYSTSTGFKNQNDTQMVAAESSTNINEIRLRAEQGDADAQYNLGLDYRNGINVGEDPVEAFKWDEKSAAQNNIHAEVLLGEMYQTGTGVTQDIRAAAQWYSRAATGGSEAGRNYLNNIRRTNELKAEAEQGDTDAQVKLAIAYAEGNGTQKDKQKAMMWYQKAADQNSAKAQFRLAVMYAHGSDVPPNEMLSDSLFRSANLLFQQSAARGDAEAEYYLGMQYLHGFGVNKDEAQGMQWLHTASEMGSGSATNLLAFLATSDAEKIKWYEKAAEQGDTTAQIALGVEYDSGRLLPPDHIQACKWFILAARNGSAGTEAACETRRDTTLKQIKTASKMADEWLTQHPYQLRQ